MEPTGGEWIEGDATGEVENKMYQIINHWKDPREDATRQHTVKKPEDARSDMTGQCMCELMEQDPKYYYRYLEKQQKFAKLCEGPYIIESAYPNGNYLLQGYEYNPVHGDRLRPYHSRNDLIPEVGSQRHAQHIVYQRWREPHRIV